MATNQGAAASKAPTGAELGRGWFEHSPFARELGLELVSMDPDRAEVRLPYRAELATVADVVHGGAISALIDTTAALAAWSGHDPAQGTRWGTVSMTVNFEGAATGQDLVAAAEVRRRGKSVSFVSVTIKDADGGRIAQSLVTYRLG